MPAGKKREGLSPGTLPKAGAEKLNEVFWAVEDKLLAQGIEPRAAATRASQIAWTRIKELYYKRGKRWVKRKAPKRKSAKKKAPRRKSAKKASRRKSSKAKWKKWDAWHRSYRWEAEPGLVYYLVLEQPDDTYWQIERHLDGELGESFALLHADTERLARAKSIAEADAKKFRPFLKDLRASGVPWQFVRADKIFAGSDDAWVMLRYWGDEDYATSYGASKDWVVESSLGAEPISRSAKGAVKEGSDEYRRVVETGELRRLGVEDPGILKIAANPRRSGDPRPRGRTREDLSSWISEVRTRAEESRRSQAWLQVDRAIEEVAARGDTVDRPTVAREIETWRRTPREPEAFNDMTISERIEILDGRIANYYDRTSELGRARASRGRSPNPVSAALKRRLMR